MTQTDGTRRFRQARAIGAAMLAVALAACSESATGPGDASTLDTQGAEANLTSLDGFFSSAQWRSFEAFGGRVDGSGVSAAVTPTIGEAGADKGAVAEAARRLVAATSQIPLISAGSLGKTFVIDPSTGEYAPDPARTGAPSNGVRFILYASIDGSDAPDLETEIGYVDLLDNGAGTPGVDLRLVAVAEGTTFLDYRVAVEGDETAGSISVDGFLLDEGDRLDFSFVGVVVDNGGVPTLSVSATLDVDSRDFHVAIDLDGVGQESDGTFTLDLSLSFEDQSVTIAATVEDGNMSAVFRVNGNVFATAEGNPDEPTIVGADGEPLSVDEIRVLGEIIEIADDVLEFLDELLEPAGNIIALGIIL
ncbi:MAG: hypothetical protein ACC682_02330 [Gemmatimonadota bacterium]